MMNRRLAATLALFGALSACDTGPITSTDPASIAGAITASDAAAAADSDADSAASRASQDEARGLTFDGKTYVHISGVEALDGRESLTVEAIVRGSEFGSNSWDSPVVSRHGSETGWELRLGQGIPRFMVTTLWRHQYAEPDHVNRPQYLAPGQWVHLAGVYDSTAISLYVNGRLTYRTRRINGRLTEYGGGIGIGYTPGHRNRFFKGEIKQVSIWSKDRSDADILADIANPPAKGPREGLFGHWDLTKVESDWSIKDSAGSRKGQIYRLP